MDLRLLAETPATEAGTLGFKVSSLKGFAFRFRAFLWEFSGAACRIRMCLGLGSYFSLLGCTEFNAYSRSSSYFSVFNVSGLDGYDLSKHASNHPLQNRTTVAQVKP